MKKPKLVQLLAAMCLVVLTGSAAPLGTTFTYQGRLNDGGNAANGNYSMVFYLYDAPTNGSQLGQLGVVTVPVSNGLFTQQLGFGAAFDGNARWLEIAVQTNGAAGFTTLSPRQPLTATPYALFAPNAGTATNASTASDAARLAGQLPSAFATAAHVHAGVDITSGTVAEPRIDAAIARVTQILPEADSCQHSGRGSFAHRDRPVAGRYLPGVSRRAQGAGRCRGKNPGGRRTLEIPLAPGAGRPRFRFGGPKQDALEALAAAAADRPSPELRDEAIAAFALTDITGSELWRSTINSISLTPAFTSDLDHYATGDAQGVVTVFRTSTGEALARFQGPMSTITTVRFSPDDHLLAVAFQNGQVIVWGLTNERVVARWTFGLTEAHGTSLDFSPDGWVLAAACGTSSVRFLDLVAAKELSPLKLEAAADRIRFRPDGGMLAVGVSNRIELWHWPEPMLVAADPIPIPRAAIGASSEEVGTMSPAVTLRSSAVARKIVPAAPTARYPEATSTRLAAREALPPVNSRGRSTTVRLSGATARRLRFPRVRTVSQSGRRAGSLP